MFSIADMYDLDRNPVVAYEGFEDLYAAARRYTRGFVDPRSLLRKAALFGRKGDDWCMSVLGRTGCTDIRRVSVVEMAMLELADATNFAPPMPPWLVEWKAQSAADHAAREAAKQAGLLRDKQRWDAALEVCSVPVEVRENLNSNHVRRGYAQHLRHVAPATAAAVSGKSRKHPEGRALCQTGSAKPFDLGEPTDEPATCVRCLDWMDKIRPA